MLILNTVVTKSVTVTMKQSITVLTTIPTNWSPIPMTLALNSSSTMLKAATAVSMVRRIRFRHLVVMVTEPH